MLKVYHKDNLKENELTIHRIVVSDQIMISDYSLYPSNELSKNDDENVKQTIQFDLKMKN